MAWFSKSTIDPSGLSNTSYGAAGNTTSVPGGKDIPGNTFRINANKIQSAAADFTALRIVYAESNPVQDQKIVIRFTWDGSNRVAYELRDGGSSSKFQFYWGTAGLIGDISAKNGAGSFVSLTGGGVVHGSFVSGHVYRVTSTVEGDHTATVVKTDIYDETAAAIVQIDSQNIYTITNPDLANWDTGYSAVCATTQDLDHVEYFDTFAPVDPEPALSVEVQAGDAVADAGTDALGNLVQNVARTRSYTLTNDGDATLTISGVTLSSGLTQTTSITNGTTIAASASTTLTVDIDTSATGAVSETISIASDDPATPYNWTISATVTNIGRLSSPIVAMPTQLNWGQEADTIDGEELPNTQRNTFRSKHAFRETCTGGIRLVYANIFIDGTVSERPSGPNLTITAALEYPENTIIPLTFDGLSEITLAPGEIIESDPVAIAPTAGDFFWDRVYVESDGDTYPVNGQSHDGTGEGASNTGNDDTQNGAFSSWERVTAGNPYVFHHCAVLGTSPTRTGYVAILGDSIAALLDSYIAGKLTDEGVKNSLIGFPGDSAVKFMGGSNGDFGSPVRLALCKRADWTVIEYGVNDILALRSSAQLIADVQELASAVKAAENVVGVWLCTLTPMCQSSDDFATVENQSPFIEADPSIWVRRQEYNAWVRTAPDEADDIAGYFDSGDGPASSPLADTWNVSEGDPTLGEGIHPSALGYSYMEPLIDASVFSLVVAVTAGVDDSTVDDTNAVLSATPVGGTEPYTYAWTATVKPSGANPSFTATAQNPTVTFDKAGSYTFSLTVTDAEDAEATDTVDVTVNQTATSIEALDLRVRPEQPITLIAYVKDQFGHQIIGESITYTLTDDLGDDDLTGDVYTAGVTQGVAEYTADSGALSDTGTITVRPSQNKGRVSPGAVRRLVRSLRRMGRR